MERRAIILRLAAKTKREGWQSWYKNIAEGAADTKNKCMQSEYSLHAATFFHPSYIPSPRAEVLHVETTRAEAFRLPVRAEVLQRCELDSRKFAAARSLDMTPPLFFPCSSYSPSVSETFVSGGTFLAKRASSEDHSLPALCAPCYTTLRSRFLLVDGGLMERRASILRLAAKH